MKSKSVSRSISISAIAVLVPVCAQAGAVVIKTADNQQQAAAAEYWTKERIYNASALPMLIEKKGSGGAADAASTETEVLGKPASTLPGSADKDADAVARAAYRADWEALEKMPEQQSAEVPTGTKGTSFPFTYTTFDVNTNTALWDIYPHKWMGKLTFTTSDGDSSCSATAINGNRIVTAAHCIYDTTNNVWYNNWAFTPAYQNGNAPYGTFTGQSCSILTKWVNMKGSYKINQWTRYDVAICTMNSNSAEQTLNEAVGYAGMIWNYGYNQLNFNSGYPAQDYNLQWIDNGPAEYLRACVNESFKYTADVVGGGCNWGPGISGGSWLVGWQPFIVNGWVDSVNSGLYEGKQNIYGARFSSKNIGVLCTAIGGCY